MNISEEELERVLPKDTAQQNMVLRKLVVTLREKLQISQEELKVCQTQLCSACKHEGPVYTETDCSQELKAAIERATVLQQDYNSLASHFDALRGGYKKILEHAEQEKCALEELRQENANLVIENERCRAQLLQLAELTEKNACLEREKQQLEKEVNESMIAAMESARQLETARAELTRTKGGSSVNFDLMKVENEALKVENEELRAEIMEVFEIASVDSIAALKEEIGALQEQLTDKDDVISKMAEETTNLRNEQLAEIAMTKQTSAQQAELLRQKLITGHENELEGLKEQHMEEIEELNKRLAESHEEVMRDEQEKEIAFEKQMAAERQLETEKAVYRKAVERAKGRYTILSEQVELLNGQRDEAESRAEALSVQLNDLERQLVEEREQNRLYQANYEDIFLKAPENSTGIEEIPPNAENITSEGEALAEAVMESLRERRAAMNGTVLESLETLKKAEDVDDIAENPEENEVSGVEIEEDEIIVYEKPAEEEDAEHIFISINHSDIAANNPVPGEYAVQIAYSGSSFISEPARILDNIIEVNFPDSINICVVLNDETKEQLKSAALDVKIKKLDGQRLVDVSQQKFSIADILAKKEIQQDMYFDIGSITISAELVEE